MSGTTIDNIVVGGPADNCKKLSRGDVVLEVDDTCVNDENVLDILVGNDVPGASVQLRVAKGGKHVRM